MTPDDIIGIFEGTVRLHQVDAQPAVMTTYIDWLSKNWRGLSSDDLAALLCIGAAAYKLQKLTQEAICPPYVETMPVPARLGPVPPHVVNVEERAWKALA
ncbi:hypothetical protein OVY01_05860 [Robbsia sp. Bb-Pol-6]|uniref:Uncharacterized protein n=1 Tax=Robbsia betulipollinis TaxID=2981849 RepID=A0ABT3ZK21_9BURK|nr:hypothetical protein [Robbsia betulipollinis]MCY0386767.1 hypothetical protein [Robbsia betulipollinis]